MDWSNWPMVQFVSSSPTSLVVGQCIILGSPLLVLKFQWCASLYDLSGLDVQLTFSE